MASSGGPTGAQARPSPRGSSLVALCALSPPGSTRRLSWNGSGLSHKTHTSRQKRAIVMALPKRSEIHPGLRVQIIEKQNQRTGALTTGVVARLLTKSATHPHGIKVMLVDGTVGRVQAIVSLDPATPRADKEVPPPEGSSDTLKQSR